MDFEDYKTPEQLCHIKGEVKRVFMTTNCSVVKELDDKSQSGLLDINKLLEEEFNIGETYHKREIVFCDYANVVCLYNSRNNSFYENGYEYFEQAEERSYVKCDDKTEYQLLKNFVNQSSKYNKFVKYENEIPRKKAFEKVFVNEENSINKKNYDNYVEITGQVLNIGKEFIKKDGSKAQFIEIQQEYEYNNKIKYNKISVMLPSNLMNSITNMRENDTISIKGKLNTYNDKNNNLKTIINCSEIKTLENRKEENKKEEMER